MKYNSTDLLQQVANRITNYAGRISKALLGAMLTDISDSAVLLKGDQTIDDIKIFSKLPKLPGDLPLRDEAIRKSYLAQALQKYDAFVTGPIIVSGTEDEIIIPVSNSGIIRKIYISNVLENNSGASQIDVFETELWEITNRNLAAFTFLLKKELHFWNIQLADPSGNNDFKPADITGFDIPGTVVRLDIAGGGSSIDPNQFEYGVVDNESSGVITLLSSLDNPYASGDNARTVAVINEPLAFSSPYTQSLYLRIKNLSGNDIHPHVFVEYLKFE